MSMTHRYHGTSVLATAGLLLIGVSSLTALAQPAADTGKLNADTFASVQRFIRPQPGESRWMDVPWMTDLHEARRKAAAEGKPLFVIASGKALSIGMC